MMETMIPPQVGMRLRTKNKKKKEKRGHKKREKAQIKKWEKKERRDNALENYDHPTFIFLTTQQLQLDT